MRVKTGSVGNMRAAVASLSVTVQAAGGERAELAEWVARQRAARGWEPAPAVVSSSAPLSALAAWTAEQRRRFDRRA